MALSRECVYAIAVSGACGYPKWHSLQGPQVTFPRGFLRTHVGPGIVLLFISPAVTCSDCLEELFCGDFWLGSARRHHSKSSWYSGSHSRAPGERQLI
jgi:hypothetical protein